MKPVIYLYRWTLKQGMEAQFEENWTRLTQFIRETCGSLGSRLHRGSNGEYFAYAQWPDAETRQRCEFNDDARTALALMNAAVARPYPEERLEIVSDLLLAKTT